MKKTKFNYIAEMLCGYKELNQRIKDREEMLMHPFVEDDTNIGGGKSNVMSNTAETTALLLVDDSELLELKKCRRVIGELLNSSRVEVRIIIEEMYIKPNTGESIRTVAPKVFLSETQAKRLRTEFFEELARRLVII